VANVFMEILDTCGGTPIASWKTITAQMGGRPWRPR
jgi:hypothetical protein